MSISTPSKPALKLPAKAIDRNSPFFRTIIHAIQGKKGENIVALDLNNIEEAVADFFIICEAQTKIQIKAIADNVADAIRKEFHEHPFHYNPGDSWTLIDYVNIVVHIFQREERKFYDIEGLWQDAEATEFQD